MENIIIVAILGLTAAAIIFYLVRQKKKGVKCVGCPDSGCCSSSKKKEETSGCGCGCHGGK